MPRGGSAVGAECDVFTDDLERTGSFEFAWLTVVRGYLMCFCLKEIARKKNENETVETFVDFHLNFVATPN
jgi:hypothetical protein